MLARLSTVAGQVLDRSGSCTDGGPRCSRRRVVRARSRRDDSISHRRDAPDVKALLGVGRFAFGGQLGHDRLGPAVTAGVAVADAGGVEADLAELRGEVGVLLVQFEQAQHVAISASASSK